MNPKIDIAEDVFARHGLEVGEVERLNHADSIGGSAIRVEVQDFGGTKSYFVSVDAASLDVFEKMCVNTAMRANKEINNE